MKRKKINETEKVIKKLEHDKKILIQRLNEIDAMLKKLKT